jgi:hypothetical protein
VVPSRVLFLSGGPRIGIPRVFKSWSIDDILNTCWRSGVPRQLLVSRRWTEPLVGFICRVEQPMKRADIMRGRKIGLDDV